MLSCQDGSRCHSSSRAEVTAAGRQIVGEYGDSRSRQVGGRPCPRQPPTRPGRYSIVESSAVEPVLTNRSSTVTISSSRWERSGGPRQLEFPPNSGVVVTRRAHNRCSPEPSTSDHVGMLAVVTRTGVPADRPDTGLALVEHLAEHRSTGGSYRRGRTASALLPGSGRTAPPRSAPACRGRVEALRAQHVRDLLCPPIIDCLRMSSPPEQRPRAARDDARQSPAPSPDTAVRRVTPS